MVPWKFVVDILLWPTWIKWYVVSYFFSVYRLMRIFTWNDILLSFQMEFTLVLNSRIHRVVSNSGRFPSYCDNEWHKVEVRIAINTISLKMDENKPVTMDLYRRILTTRTESAFFIGGYKSKPFSWQKLFLLSSLWEMLSMFCCRICVCSLITFITNLCLVVKTRYVI